MTHKENPDHCFNSAGARIVTLNKQPYARKKLQRNDADFKVVLRRCAFSDEWLVVVPDYNGEIIVVVANSREFGTLPTASA